MAYDSFITESLKQMDLGVLQSHWPGDQEHKACAVFIQVVYWEMVCIFLALPAKTLLDV